MEVCVVSTQYMYAASWSKQRGQRRQRRQRNRYQYKRRELAADCRCTYEYHWTVE